MADRKPGNFTSCCRLCLTENSDLKSIFDANTDDRHLPDKILTFVDVEVLENDKVSTMVCIQCITIINTWQNFKIFCGSNQTKLKERLDDWSQQSDVANLSFNIKEEPVEQNLLQPEIVTVVSLQENELNGDHCEQNINDDPPNLQRFDCDTENASPVSLRSEMNRTCRFCSKLFSSSGNRKKHEKVVHPEEHKNATPLEEKGSESQDDRSQSSIDSQLSADKEVEKTNNPERGEITEADEKKILFAAGLRLLHANSSPLISQEPLSKIEVSYIEKCKAMVNMYKTLECACHNVQHPTLKGLLSHLRSLRIWFPVFTCYNCMITFTDRSTHCKHIAKCPRTQLETLVKLSNLRKRSDVKTRLYQNYKCTQCKFMYSFHDDFCKHVDEEHIPHKLPFYCKCSKELLTVDDFKEHSYFNCCVHFYCDICFITTASLEEFQKHAAEVHDSSEGFILLQDDNYKKRKSVVIEKLDESVIVTGKRRRSLYDAPRLDPEVKNSKPLKVINPVSAGAKSTVCPICHKKYSNRSNMLQHYKTHSADELRGQHNGNDYVQDDSLYSCPDCGGMFTAAEWEPHKESHEKRVCNECGKVFQFQSELDQHRSVHLNLKISRDSKTKSYTSTMLSPNSEGANILVMCEICDSMFKSKEELREHKLTHKDDDILPMQLLEIKQEPVETTPRKKVYECKMCNKVYSGYGGLWDHNKKKHPDGANTISTFPKQCKDCDKVLYTGGSYFMHKQMHERINKTLQQTESKPPTPSKPKVPKKPIKADEEDVEVEESYHTCKRCFKVFSSKYNLKNHMKCHGVNTSAKNTKSKKIWCNICHQQFNSVENLNLHKENEHTELEPSVEIFIKNPEMEPVDVKPTLQELKNPFIFTCDSCTKTFTTKIALKKHKEKHLLETEEEIIPKKTVYVYCKYCKIPFATVDLLNKHMSLEHSEESKAKPPPQKTKQFACKVCKKAFISASALHAHAGWHKRGKVEKQVKTQEKLFRKMVNNLSNNQQMRKQQFQCVTCFQLFPNDAALQIHILAKHRNVNAIAVLSRCNACNIDFTSQEEYESHRRLHEVAEKKTMQQAQQKFSKNFPCNFCPAAFSRSDTLTAHLRQIHKEIVKHEFKCNQCERTFDKQTSLSIHLKVHEKQRNMSTTSKPLFSCSICNMGFDLPKDLRSHTINAHPF